MKLFKKILKYFLYFHMVLLVAGILAQCSFQHYATQSYEEAIQEVPFDAVIVPGVPYEDTSMNIVYKARVLWAKHLYDSGYTKNIIFSGSAVYTQYVESRTMKLYAEKLGVPGDHIYTEEKAEHSTENVYYSWKLARKLGFRKVALATDPYQSGMLRGLIKKYTPGVMSIPIQFSKIDPRNKTLPPIDPATARVSPFVALPKRESFWKRFQGTMGKRVKEEAKQERKSEVRSPPVLSFE